MAAALLRQANSLDKRAFTTPSKARLRSHDGKQRYCRLAAATFMHTMVGKDLSLSVVEVLKRKTEHPAVAFLIECHSLITLLYSMLILRILFINRS